MTKLLLGVIAALALAVGLIVTASKAPDSTSLGSNLMLNIAAESLGIALTLLLSLVAIRAARKRFGNVAAPLTQLIKTLRSDRTISPQAARKTVVCAVALLSDEGFLKARGATSRAHETCDICSLKVIVDTDTKGARCSFCKLPKEIWNTEL